MAATTVTDTEIIIGLMSDPNFERWGHFKMVTDELLRLPEILGPDRVAEHVTFRGIMLAFAELCQAVLATDFESADQDGRIRRQLIGVGNGYLRVAELMGDIFDQYEPNTQDYFLFIPTVREFYMARTLTYADLLRLQPGIFVPKYYPGT